MIPLSQSIQEALKARLLSLFQDISQIKFNSIKSGFSVYFFGIKAMEFIFQKSKFLVKIAAEDGEIGPGFARPVVKFQFQDPSIIDEQKSRIIAAYEYCADNEKADVFACCAYYTQCSDQRSCLLAHDPEYRGCLYRKNLEAGRIFYGKNRNYFFEKEGE